MIWDSRHRKLCRKPGITLKMDEQMENVLTTVSVLALSYLKPALSSDPAVLYSLYEKQAERYLRVTKSGVLTGFSSLQKRCITKNEHCCSYTGEIPSFCFLESLNSPLLLAVGKKRKT